MRVDERKAPQGLGKMGASRGRASGMGEFAVSGDTQTIAEQAKTSASGTTHEVSALFQLQIEENSPRETRKRGVKRGVKLLDGLDRLKAAFLIGADRGADWDQLAAEFQRPRDPNMPGEVAHLLDEVDVRVAVELAKRGR